MIVELIKLKNNIEDFASIDFNYSFTKEELQGTDIEELNNVKITGDITKNSIDGLYIDMDIKGVMILPCAITLKPVNYPFQVHISGNLDEIMKEIDENAKKIENTLDIFPIVWENILLEIPMKVVSDEASSLPLKGEGWQFITDESESNHKNQLKDLLK